MKSRLAKLAVAAAIIMAVMIGVIAVHNLKTDPSRIIVEEDDSTQKDINNEKHDGSKRGLEQGNDVTLAAKQLHEELQHVEDMFTIGDVNGLVTMLDHGQWESKIAAANYLARTDDLHAIPLLERLSEKWQQPNQGNPFAQAITAIQEHASKHAEDKRVVSIGEPHGDVNHLTASPNDIYIQTIWSMSDGAVIKDQEWLKNGTMVRKEHSSRTIIDDGVNRLVLDPKEKTAQFSGSYAAFENFLEEDSLEIVGAFLGHETDAFKIAPLPRENDSNAPTHKVVYRDLYQARAWVDAQSNLPVRLLTDTVTHNEEPRLVAVEMIIRYDSLSLDHFKMIVPPGFEELERIKTPTISGIVVNEHGNGVANTEVYTSDIMGDKQPLFTTQKDGVFMLKFRPGSWFRDRKFPLIVWAIPQDLPGEMAWMIIRNPGQEQTGNSGLEIHDDSAWVRLDSRSTSELDAYMPGAAGQLIIENNSESPRVYGIEGVVLEIVPASIITGRVTDTRGQAVANAEVSVEYMDIELKRSRIFIGNIQETKQLAITDANGYYELNHLPRLWSKISLSAQEGSYVIGENIFERDQSIIEPDADIATGCNFILRDRGVVIRGTVIDNWGEPLVDREVDIEMRRSEDDDEHDDEMDFEIEQAVIDADGYFELADVPMVEGLSLVVESGFEIHHWRDNAENQGKEFVYYLETKVPISFDPNQKEYWIEITPQRADIIVEVEVLNSMGEPLAGIPLGLYSTNENSDWPNSDIHSEWCVKRLMGITNEKGMCVITGVPQVQQLGLWICKPDAHGGWDYWGKKISEEITQAIAESQESYISKKLPIKLEANKKNYRVSVTLSGNRRKPR